jgi:DNA-binding transcriptional LysR family regulator
MSRLDTVDLRLLRVFATVVETRGFTAAQTVLNVTASTISNQISALETRLGVKLCQRGRAGFKLTEDGEQIFSEAQKLFAAIDSFDLRASALRAHIRSNLIIGLVDNIVTDSNAKIAELLRQFTASVRDVQLAIVVKAPNELLRDLLDEKIGDCALLDWFRRIGADFHACGQIPSGGFLDLALRLLWRALA